MATRPETIRGPNAVGEAPAAAGWRTGDRFALPAILLLGAGLRMWRLDQNGYGTEYYAAGVRSMLTNWHNFFYNAFDPAGFVSVDKPPVALWVQVASAKLFGFHGLSLLLPRYWKAWPRCGWFTIWSSAALGCRLAGWRPFSSPSPQSAS